MADGLVDRMVSVLGCGPVGQSAISALLRHGAWVSIYDIDSAKCRTFINSLVGTASDRITVAPDLRSALAGATLLVDASNAAGIIRTGDITPQTYIAAPGVPLGLIRNACIKIADRLLHDPLQLGVATMGMQAVKLIAHKKTTSPLRFQPETLKKDRSEYICSKKAGPADPAFRCGSILIRGCKIA